jgi:hypothetical protein
MQTKNKLHLALLACAIIFSSVVQANDIFQGKFRMLKDSKTKCHINYVKGAAIGGWCPKGTKYTEAEADFITLQKNWQWINPIYDMYDDAKYAPKSFDEFVKMPDADKHMMFTIQIIDGKMSERHCFKKAVETACINFD